MNLKPLNNYHHCRCCITTKLNFTVSLSCVTFCMHKGLWQVSDASVQIIWVLTSDHTLNRFAKTLYEHITNTITIKYLTLLEYTFYCLKKKKTPYRLTTLTLRLPAQGAYYYKPRSFIFKIIEYLVNAFLCVIICNLI